MFNQVMSLQNSPTYRRSLAERLERERASKNDGTIPGGLASMIDAGTAGYLRYRDDQDRTKAQSAMMGGITEATDIGEMGEDQIPAGPEGALYRLGQLEDNPYAGRLSQMLTFEQMQRQQQAEALAGDRAWQAQQTQGQQDFQREMLGMQQGFQRSMQRPPERRIVEGPDGRPYYADTAEPVLPGVQGRGGFSGNSMDAQAWNIVSAGDTSDPRYAAAYAHLSQPKFNPATQTSSAPSMDGFKPPVNAAGEPIRQRTQVVQPKLPPEQASALKATAQNTLRLIDGLRNDPGLDANLGWSSMVPNRPEGEAADAKAKIDNLLGKAFMQAFEMLKGGGQITEKEGAAAAAAISRMQAVIENRGSKPAFIDALNEFEQTVKIGAQKLGVDVQGGGASSADDPLGIR